MRHIRRPRTRSSHPDHFLNCQEAVTDAFAKLADDAVAAGWTRAEVAAALVDVADCYMLKLAADMDTEGMIRDATSRFRRKG